MTETTQKADVISVLVRNGRFNLLNTSEVTQDIHIRHPVIAEIRGDGKNYLSLTALEDEWGRDDWWGDVVQDAASNALQRYLSSDRAWIKALVERFEGEDGEELEASFNTAFAEQKVRMIDQQVERLTKERRTYQGYLDRMEAEREGEDHE